MMAAPVAAATAPGLALGLFSSAPTATTTTMEVLAAETGLTLGTAGAVGRMAGTTSLQAAVSYAGGTYSGLRSMATAPNAKIEAHHMFSVATLQATGKNVNKAPAIQMGRVDHQKTPTWGPSKAARRARAEELSLVQNGKTAQASENAAKAVEKNDPGKYTSSINEEREAARFGGYYE